MVLTDIGSFVCLISTLLAHSAISTSSSTNHTSVSPEYIKLLVLGQCKARCLNQEGEKFPLLDTVSKFLTNPSTCIGVKCQHCQQCMDTKISVVPHNRSSMIPILSISGRDGYAHSSLAEFHAECSVMFRLPTACFHRQHRLVNLDNLNVQTFSIKLTIDELFESPKAIFHCSQKISAGIFQAAFRLEYLNHTQTLNQFSRMDVNLIPRIFLVKKIIIGKSAIASIEYFITSNWTIILDIAESESVQLKVTAVAGDGIYPPSYSDIIQLKDTQKRGRGGPPKDLRVVEIKKKEEEEAQEMNVDYNSPSMATAAKKPIAQFEVLLHWNSGSGFDATCHYGIFALLAMELKERKTAEEAFWFVVDGNLTKSDITYGTQIDFNVFEIPEIGIEENSTKIKVYIPSCLEFEQGNFDLCDPPPVRNLSAELSPGNLLTINWEAPLYSNATNQIEEYRVTKARLIKFFSNNSWNWMHNVPTELVKSVSGNITHLEQIVTGNYTNSSFIIYVHAIAKGGISKAAQFTINRTLASTPDPMSSSSSPTKIILWDTIGIIIGLLFLFVVSFFGIKNFAKKLYSDRMIKIILPPEFTEF